MCKCYENKIIKTNITTTNCCCNCCCDCCCNCYINKCITVYPCITQIPIKYHILQSSLNKTQFDLNDNCNILKNPDGNWNAVYDKLKYIMYTNKR